MKNKAMKITFIAICLLDLYLIGFFFSFERVNVTVAAGVRDISERTGPPGISLVAPHGNYVVRRGLYYFYYPIHSVFEAKGWMHPTVNIEELMDS